MEQIGCPSGWSVTRKIERGTRATNSSRCWKRGRRNSTLPPFWWRPTDIVHKSSRPYCLYSFVSPPSPIERISTHRACFCAHFETIKSFSLTISKILSILHTYYSIGFRRKILLICNIKTLEWSPSITPTSFAVLVFFIWKTARMLSEKTTKYVHLGSWLRSIWNAHRNQICESKYSWKQCN